MPYNHPLGVSCMTLGEFWASEAKKEGCEASELMDNFYSEIAADEERSRQEVLNDKPGALSMLRAYYDPEYGDNDFIPTEVLEMQSAEVRNGMRVNSTSFVAKVMCSDGQERTLQYKESHYAGSYMDPPDFDCNCVVLG